MFRQLSVFVCLAATGGAALAQESVATSGVVRGSVLVNRGSGFVRLAPNAQLLPGDRLMANRGGRATIVYADGCTVQVRPGSTATVQTASPCSLASQPADGASGVGGSVGGLGVPGTLAATGAAAGFIAAIVLATTQNGGGGGGGGGNPVPPISP